MPGNHVSRRVLQEWSYWFIILAAHIFPSFFTRHIFLSPVFSFWGLKYFLQHQLQKFKQAVA